MLNVMLKAIFYNLEKNVMLSCDFYSDEMRKDTNGYTLTGEKSWNSHAISIIKKQKNKL